MKPRRTEEHDAMACPQFPHAIELIGKRWTGAIVREFFYGAKRFSDVRDAIPGMTDRMLSERLKELEAEGIVGRTVTPETPVRIEYSLTPKGRALLQALKALGQWASTWAEEKAPVAS
jgi:DNA-binding HxlR family transcriptional regulator